MSLRPLLVLGALAIAAGWSLPAQAQFDTVVITKGAPLRGTVTKMSRDKVTLNINNTERDVDANEVVRILYDGEPADLNNARNEVLQKNYKSALEHLAKAAAAKLDRDVMKQDVDFYRALCLVKLAITEGGDRAAAQKAMFDFAGANSSSYHFYDSAEALGELALATAKFDEAARFYGAFAKAPWPEHQLRGRLGEARAAAGAKDFATAAAKYNEVVNHELNTVEVAPFKALARVGRAVCQAETGQVDPAIKDLQDIIEKNDPQDVKLFARTYNALGACYQKAGKPKDALQAYLFTDVLFYAESEAHAEALYHLSKLWDTVNRSDRAISARNTLKERYAGSIWASQN